LEVKLLRESICKAADIMLLNTRGAFSVRIICGYGKLFRTLQRDWDLKTMKQILHNIYLNVAVRIPHTAAWKARKRKKASDESQGSITFYPSFYINEGLPVPAELL
jgi:hypothetical protein